MDHKGGLFVDEAELWLINCSDKAFARAVKQTKKRKKYTYDNLPVTLPPPSL